MIVELERWLLLEFPPMYDSAYALIPVNCGSWYPKPGQGGMYVDVVVQTSLPLWSGNSRYYNDSDTREFVERRR